MQKFKLEDIVPQPSSFKLKENGKTYSLRPYTLADAAWAHARYGEERVAAFFGNSPDPEMIMAFAYLLMNEKQQADFSPQSCTFRDVDTGRETKGEIGGAKLLGHMVKGPQQTMEILAAVKTSIGLSQSLLDKLKKKTAQALAGEESSRRPLPDGDSAQTKSAS